MRLFARRRPIPLPPRAPRPERCWTTACRYPGIVTATLRGTSKTVRVCSGCYADGVVRGAFTS